MPDPRGVEDRLTWFLTHDPGGVGWCMRHCWHALGGDQGNPPRWGCPDANCVYDKVITAGRYWTTPPPRGALILWRYGNNGHAALALGDGRILTTDPAGRPGQTGVESMDYPERAWGASPDRRIWTDTYSGTTFPVEEKTMAVEYHFGGKPTGVQHIGTSYVDLDMSRWNPKAKGLQLDLQYLNIKAPKFTPDGARMGLLRVRKLRISDNDATAYVDVVVIAGSHGAQLVTLPYFEDGDGQPCKYQAKCVGDLLECDIDTRYTKGAVIS